MSTSLYKEVLADAKQLREVAEQNATKLILEKVQPRVKQMIERELLEGNDSDCDDDEEDIMYDSDEEKKSEKVEESEVDEVELTRESISALAKMANMDAETYGVKALRLSERLKTLRSNKKNISEVAYCEKLRQLKTEAEKTYGALQADSKRNIVPKDTCRIIEGKLEEVYKATNTLYVPTKVRLIERKYNLINKKSQQFKLVVENYDLTNKAKKTFVKECSSFIREARTLKKSLSKLQEFAEENKLNKFATKMDVLVREIYTMAKKHGALNEEELKLVIRGLDPADPEGSELSVEAEPEDGMDDGLEGDDMGMDDMDMDDGMDDMGMDDGMDDMDGGLEDDDLELEMELGEGELSEEEISELLGGSSYRAGGGRGRGSRAAARQARAKASAQAPKQQAPVEEPEEEERQDEMLQISEEMLKRELMSLRKRRAAMNEEDLSKQGGHGPGKGDDDFGGGKFDGESFVDGEDLNTLDPAGSNALTEEEDDDEKSEMYEGAVRMNRRLAETLKQYKSALSKQKRKLTETQRELSKTNLFNAKLVHANRLLQTEGLSGKQRATIIEALDDAKSVRDVKKLYSALSEALQGKKSDNKLTESKGRALLAGSSPATKSGSKSLNESETKEFHRWGQLAGMND